MPVPRSVPDTQSINCIKNCLADCHARGECNKNLPPIKLKKVNSLNTYTDTGNAPITLANFIDFDDDEIEPPLADDASSVGSTDAFPVVVPEDEAIKKLDENHQLRMPRDDHPTPLSILICNTISAV